MRRDYWFLSCALITVASAGVSAAFSLLALMPLGSPNSLAMYGAARSVPIAVAALLLAWRRSRNGVKLLCYLMASIQMLDALVGLNLRDAAKTMGPTILALAGMLSARLTSKRKSGQERNTP